MSQNALVGAITGLIAGLSVAIGGAIKDSPQEGFKMRTFLRSPIIGTVEGAIIGEVVNPNPVLTYFATIGTERVTVEGYKLVRSQVPGKFKNCEWQKPIMEAPKIQLKSEYAQILS